MEQLRGGGSSVVMLTGDALLTAVHVASETGIIGGDKSRTLLLQLLPAGAEAGRQDQDQGGRGGGGTGRQRNWGRWGACLWQGGAAA